MALAWIRGSTGNFDEALVVTSIVAFLGLRRRFWDDAESSEFVDDRIEILEALEASPYPCQIPDSLNKDASVMSDIVWVDGYPEIEQTIRMLRALAT